MTALAALDALAVVDPLAWLKRYTPEAVPSRYGSYHRHLVQLPKAGESQARVVFRGAAKSTTVRGMVLHSARHRKVRGILLVRATYSDAKADREALVRSAAVAGVEAANDGDTKMVLVGDVPIWTRTPGGAVRGIHWVNPKTGEVVRPELVVIDDLETRDSARSSEQTRKIRDWLFSDALATGDPAFPLRVIMLGTPITPSCLIAQAMRQEPPFDSWTPPLVVPVTDRAGNPAWPDRFDPTLEARTPPITMATEYRLEPVPADTLLFPPHLTRWQHIPASAAHEVVVAVDPAGDGEDATAAVAMILGPSGLHVVDCLHYTGPSAGAPDAIGLFVSRLRQAGWILRGLTFEGVGAWLFMKREVARIVAPLTVTSDVPTRSKVERALPLTLWHNNGALSADPALKGTAWDIEMHSFDQHGATVSGHDDCLDATAWAGGPLTRGWKAQSPTLVPS